MAGHAALPHAENHQRVRHEFCPRVQDHVAQAATEDDTYHDCGNEGGFIDHIADGRHRLATPVG
jgi:hypothetical protein